MTAAIQARFIQLGVRRVSWRSAGAGPAAVLLHGSPQSSRALEGLGHAVAATGQCAIMPDTPGAGHSEALAANPLTIAQLADALAEFADAIGLTRFPLYGSHTGAAIATAFAARYPHRVTALVLDGLAAWTTEERTTYTTTYAPPFIPSPDGAHLTWLWSRMEAQSLFFPWHRQEPATWRGVDLSPPWHLHRNAMDMLDSGDAYRAIYQASLAFDPGEFLPNVQAPARLMMASSDVLKNHAQRPALQTLPLDLYSDPPSLWQAVAASLASHPGDPAPPISPPGLFWRGTLEGNGRPLVMLHQAGASSRVFQTELHEHAGPVIAFDLPGHGFNTAPMPTAATEIAAAITTACRNLGLTSYTAGGRRFGAIIAHAMASPSVTAATTEPPSAAPGLAARGAINLDPIWDGSHLLRAWRVATRQAIWDPWYDTTTKSTRHKLADLNPAAIHEAATDLLRAGPAWHTANAIEAGAAFKPPAA